VVTRLEKKCKSGTKPEVGYAIKRIALDRPRVGPLGWVLPIRRREVQNYVTYYVYRAFFGYLALQPLAYIEKKK